MALNICHTCSKLILDYSNLCTFVTIWEYQPPFVFNHFRIKILNVWSMSFALESVSPNPKTTGAICANSGTTRKQWFYFLYSSYMTGSSNKKASKQTNKQTKQMLHYFFLIFATIHKEMRSSRSSDWLWAGLGSRIIFPPYHPDRFWDPLSLFPQE
jgi:hypothetical protein